MTLRVVAARKAFAGRPVLDGVSLEVNAGEVVALLGASGAGKTTLFRGIARLEPLDSGEIWLAGEPLHSLSGTALSRARREASLVFQQFNLVRRLSALDNVLAGRLGRVALWRAALRRFSSADRQRALAALDRVGLLAQAYQRADTLSGGQQQRVAIARALAQESHLLLADEPVASLDEANAQRVLALLRDLAQERGLAVLTSLHQPDLAAAYATRVVRLADGRIEPFTPPEPAATPPWTSASDPRRFADAPPP